MPLFNEWRTQTRTLRSIAAYHLEQSTFVARGNSQEIPLALVSASYFTTLGVRPEMGRGLIEEDDRWGARPVVVLSDSLWRTAFSGDPSIVGQSVEVDGTVSDVVGIMPPHASVPGIAAAAWAPIVPAIGFLATDARSHVTGAIARIRAGAARDVVQRELATLADRVANENAPTSGRRVSARVAVVALREFGSGDVRSVLALVFAVSVAVLLIACVNVGNLLLAAGAGRRHEMAVRSALGASSVRLMLQLFGESATLALLGAGGGLLLATWATKTVAVLAAGQLPRATEIGLHVSAVGVAALLAGLCTAVCGLGPAVAVGSASPAEALRSSSPTTTSSVSQKRGRACLVAVELALTIGLLSGAAVLGRRVIEHLTLPAGYASDHVFVASLMRPFGAWPSDIGPMSRFGTQLTARLEDVRGIRAAAISLEMPGTRMLPGYALAAQHGNASADTLPINGEIVTPDYFKTLGIPILRGRSFDSRDRPNAPGVVIISRTLESRLFPGGNAVGGEVLVWSASESRATPSSYDVVGVAGDVRGTEPAHRVIPEMYSPFSQGPYPHMTVLIRSEMPTKEVAVALRRVVGSLDETQAIDGFRPLDDVFTETAARPRFYLVLISVFAATALILAIVGLYGVMSLAVRERTREIGIRMAFGADSARIARLVLAQGARLVGIGVVAGLGASYATTRILRALFPGVEALDPAAIGCAVVLFVVVAFVAIYLPARTATCVDPVTTLRDV